jgi:hypothetical protein
LSTKQEQIERYAERHLPLKEKEIFVYSIEIESIAVDGENIPLDTQILTAYFSEPAFPFEIEEWAKTWIDAGYRVLGKDLVQHQKLNLDKRIFETVWELLPVREYEF